VGTNLDYGALMQPAFESLAAGFPQLIFYLLMVAVIYVLAILIYVKLTPHKELELVQSGNVAAAVHFSSLVLSMALPVAACLINKFSLYDVGVGPTIVLGAFKLAGSIILAFAIAG